MGQNLYLALIMLYLSEYPLQIRNINHEKNNISVIHRAVFTDLFSE